MSGAKQRLQNLAAHFFPSSASSSVKGGSTSSNVAANNNTQDYSRRSNFHTLSPTNFLPRAAAIEPNVLF